MARMALNDREFAVTAVRWLLGIQSLGSGINWWIKILPFPNMHEHIEGPVKHEILRVLIESGWMFSTAKVLEIIGGACLVFNRFVPLGLVLLMPVTVNIFLVNVPWSPLPHVQLSVTRNLVMHCILLAAYANYFYPMLKARSAPQPVWRDPSRIWKSF